MRGVDCALLSSMAEFVYKKLLEVVQGGSSKNQTIALDCAILIAETF